jgi:hypothetical protein
MTGVEFLVIGAHRRWPVQAVARLRSAGMNEREVLSSVRVVHPPR